MTKKRRVATRRALPTTQTEPEQFLRALTVEEQTTLTPLIEQALEGFEKVVEQFPEDGAHAHLVVSMFQNSDGTATIGGYFQGHSEPLIFALEEACRKEPRFAQALEVLFMRRFLSHVQTQDSSPTMPQS